MHFHGLKSLSLTASLDTTAVPGILTNSTDDPIASNNRQDYSFKPHVDTPDPITLVYDGTAAVGSRLAGSTLPESFYYDDTPQHDGSHGAIVLKVWCKGFGGNCEITFSGTAELWGVSGTLDFSGLKVELPFTVQDKPIYPAVSAKWLVRQFGSGGVWQQIYGKDDPALEAKRIELFGYGVRIPMSDKSDAEPEHPGKPYDPNTFAAHRKPGDGLTIWDEYYRVWVTGGGYDPDGNPHPRLASPEEVPTVWYWVRLSPAIKELLVQVDVMKGITNFTLNQHVGPLMADVSKRFSDKIDGAGIRLYWTLDEGQATPSLTFPDPAARDDWGKAHRDIWWFPEHVHLCFAADNNYGETGARISPGDANGSGAFVFVELARKIAEDDDYDHHLFFVHCISHEITHLLLKERGTGGFWWDEHLYLPSDARYLMYGNIEDVNATIVIFSNKTRACLNLKSKETVERFTRFD